MLKKIFRSKRLSQILILASFIVTFAIIRTITILQKFDILPNQTGDVHIHHLVWGILLLLICGYIGISFWASDRVRHFMAILFGIGSALTIDEFALWLYLDDVYWHELGRISIDAIIYTVAIFSLVFVISEVHDHQWFKKFLSRK
jgi:hypothetical protein